MSAHILVVDDEPDIHNIIKEILEDEGFTVSIAANGNTARKIRAEEHPDLILLDVEMPKMDGAGFLKHYIKNTDLPKVPIIAVSSNDLRVKEILGLGASAFLVKPVTKEKLLSAIRQAQTV